jgi:hypothetical protein
MSQLSQHKDCGPYLVTLLCQGREVGLAADLLDHGVSKVLLRGGRVTRLPRCQETTAVPSQVLVLGKHQH